MDTKKNDITDTKIWYHGNGKIGIMDTEKLESWIRKIGIMDT